MRTLKRIICGLKNLLIDILTVLWYIWIGYSVIVLVWIYIWITIMWPWVYSDTWMYLTDISLVWIIITLLSILIFIVSALLITLFNDIYLNNNDC